MLNPCPRCNSINIKVNGDFVYCGNCGYSRVTIENMQKQKKAIDAWNTANPINDAKMEQNAALEAVQQALAAVLIHSMAISSPLWRLRVMDRNVRTALDLLITQGVLVETDGKITLK